MRTGWLGRQKLVLALVLLGLALRAYHYLRDRNVWHDEAAVLVNIVSRGFLELTGPLEQSQAAAPLFLWLIRGESLLLGDTSLALRLAPFVASCLSLVLLSWVAWRRLEPRAVPWAVLLFATSETLLWHACEVKPYAFDILAATLLLAAWCSTEGTAPGRRILLFTVLAPVLIFLSYPACFLHGGLLVALAPAVLRERRARLPYGVLASVVSGCFLLLLLGPVRGQHTRAMHEYWSSCMADWQRPWQVPIWSLLSTFEVLRYACKPLGQALAGLAVLGGIALWRGSQRAWVVLLIVPAGLALLAALLQRYPYGGTRVMVYAAPALILLIAAGAAPALSWLAQRSRVGAVVLVVLLLMPVGFSLGRVFFVWNEADVRGASTYVLDEYQDGDAILGNDWAHLYYFRRQPAFVLYPRVVQVGKRLWLVITTANLPREARHHMAPDLAPPGWHAIACRELAETTVFLYVPESR
jgi:hypothetical protein